MRGHCIGMDKILKPFIVRLVHFRFFVVLKQVLTGVFLPVAVKVRLPWRSCCVSERRVKPLDTRVHVDFIVLH